MIIRPCNFRSEHEQPKACKVIKAISTDTTAEAFDQVLTKYPEYRLHYGANYGWNALGVAAKYGNIPLILHIVRIGGRHLLHLGNIEGMTPLYCAACCEDREKGFQAAKVLLSLGSSVNTAAGFNYYANDDRPTGAVRFETPLYAAAVKTQNLKLVKLLLIHGGAIHQNTEMGCPYFLPIREQRLPIVLINQAREELDKWKLFRLNTVLSKESLLPPIIVNVIRDYLNGDLSILPPEHKPREKDLEEGMLSDLFQ